MIVRTDAIVLRTLDYGETSRIVTLLTRSHGKMAVLAKGARLTKSRFGGTLQPMAYLQIVFYHKVGRGLQILSESSHLASFPRIYRDLEKIAVGLRIVELVNATVQEEEQSPIVFNLLLHTLEQLDGAVVRGQNLLPYFQLKLAAVLGFSPDIDRAAVQSLPAEGGVMIPETGAVLTDAQARAGARRASRGALRAFAICARAESDPVLRLEMSPAVRQELDDLVELFLRYHLGDAYPSRAERVNSQILDQSQVQVTSEGRNA